MQRTQSVSEVEPAAQGDHVDSRLLHRCNLNNEVFYHIEPAGIKSANDYHTISNNQSRFKPFSNSRDHTEQSIHQLPANPYTPAQDHVVNRVTYSAQKVITHSEHKTRRGRSVSK